MNQPQALALGRRGIKLKKLAKTCADPVKSAAAHKEAADIRHTLNLHHGNKCRPQRTYVYFLSNPSLGEIKIGFTTRAIADRMAELDRSTSIPTPFVLVGYAAVADPYQVEQKIHKRFKQYRTNPKREFFNITNEQIAEVVKAYRGVSCFQ